MPLEVKDTLVAVLEAGTLVMVVEQHQEDVLVVLVS
jgi:hypothetical protein